MDKELY